MAATKQLISTVTVGSGGAASISFSSIPSTFTDLVVVLSGLWTGSGNVAMYLTLNGSTSNFTARYLYGNPGAGSPASGTLARYIGSIIAVTNTPNNTSIYFPNYAGSAYKSYSVDNVDENNASGADINLIAGLWSDTAAINSITLAPGTSSFGQYSSASLYGITSGNGGATVS